MDTEGRFSMASDDVTEAAARPATGAEPPIEVNADECQEIPAAEALARLLKDGVLEHALVRGLAAAGQTFPLRVRLTRCLLVDADFQGATFADGADFGGSTFEGSTRFGDQYEGIVKAKRPWVADRGAHFDGPVSFAGCVFRGPFYATGARFAGPATFRHAWFKDTAAFPGAVFESRAWFVHVRCDRTFSMWEARLSGEIADFSESDFTGTVAFNRALVRQRSSFWGSSFLGEVRLHLARFEGETNFVRARFAGLLDISRATFAWPVDLHASDLAGSIAIRSVEAPRILVERSQVAGRIASEALGLWPTAQRDYGQLKNIFEANNDYGSMDWAYFRFRRSQRRGARMNPLRRAAEWLLLDVGTGYGTKPFNIGLLILGGIALFGIVYASFPGELYYAATGLDRATSGPTMDPLAAVYFSTATLTTIGLGDWIPRPDGWMRFVVTGESLLGLFLMALFVTMLTRRVVR